MWTFALLDSKSTWIVLFVDESLAPNANITSQKSFAITIIDENNIANIVHYSSFKEKCITGGVLAAQLFALGYAVIFATTK